MTDIVERLRSWAQNEEMVDSYFTEHGRDCNEAADRIERAVVAVRTARDNINSLICAYPDRFPKHAFERIRDLLEDALATMERTTKP